MNNLNPKIKLVATISLHFLLWGLWFAAPFLFSFNDPKNNEPPRDPNFYFFIWIPMIFAVILFYLNYFVFIEKLLFNKKFIWFLLLNLALIVAFAYFNDQVRELFRGPEPNFMGSKPFPNNIPGANQPQFQGGKPPKGFLGGLHTLTFFFIVSISVAIKTTSRWIASENLRKNLENENLKSELSNLKMQLNPHFFFNTLNNIYSLIKVSPDKAQEAVHGLAKLMRYHLYETNEEKVNLSAEVDFLKNYIDLMRIRMNPNVNIETDFSIENPTAQIAPLLFISLVENSFKHGVSATEESFIKILMTEKNRILSFIIMNTDFPQRKDGPRESGIGFENLKKRLALIYPDKHVLSQSYKSKYFHVNVTIQL